MSSLLLVIVHNLHSLDLNFAIACFLYIQICNPAQKPPGKRGFSSSGTDCRSHFLFLICHTFHKVIPFPDTHLFYCPSPGSVKGELLYGHNLCKVSWLIDIEALVG